MTLKYNGLFSAIRKRITVAVIKELGEYIFLGWKDLIRIGIYEISFPYVIKAKQVAE